MHNEHFSDAEYEVAIEHTGRLALIYHVGPSAEEVADFPVWKKLVCRLLPRGQPSQYGTCPLACGGRRRSTSPGVMGLGQCQGVCLRLRYGGDS